MSAFFFEFRPGINYDQLYLNLNLKYIFNHGDYYIMPNIRILCLSLGYFSFFPFSPLNQSLRGLVSSEQNLNFSARNSALSLKFCWKDRSSRVSGKKFRMRDVVIFYLPPLVSREKYIYLNGDKAKKLPSLSSHNL